MAYITGCALMAACLSLALVALIGRATSDVVELCGETRENIILNKASDLEQLSLKGCPKRTVSAYYDLLDMASEDEPVCSMDKVSKITRFFDNYHGDPSDQEESEKLPGGIRRFSVAYGMLVGHICRVALLDKFFNDTNDYLFDGDFRALQPWIKNDGPLAHLLDPLVIHMEFLLPSYFEPVYPGFREDYKQSLFADVSHGDLASAKQVCQYRFKPMYERAILPISHLDHTGISYLYRNRKIALKDSPELCDSIALWQRIVFVCELLLNTNRQRKEASRSGEKTTSLVANCSDDDDDNNDDEELDPDDRTTREDLVNSTGSQSTICKIQYEPEPSYFDSEAQLCSIPWVNQLIMRNVNMKKFAATKISRTMSKIMPHIRRFKESWQDNTLDVVEKLYDLSCPDNKHGKV